MSDWTPLNHAIHKDQPAAVDALIHVGAAVNSARAIAHVNGCDAAWQMAAR